MGSFNGRIASPYLAPYAASKHALEALNDALRLELRAWGIRVSVIEPGATTTPIWDKSLAAADALADEAERRRLGLYKDDLDAMRQATRKLAEAALPVDSRRALRRPRPDRAAALGPLSGGPEGESAAAGL